MVQTIVYNGSFDGFLCAVFDVYEHKFEDVNIVPAYQHQPSLFTEPHFANLDLRHSHRVWKGLQNKLAKEAQEQLQRAFLSELAGIENILLRRIQDAFAAEGTMQTNEGSEAARQLAQTAEKVLREQQQWQTFIRFRQATDGLHFAVIAPAYNVLPLLAAHFQTVKEEQRWLLFDTRRQYGMYGDTNTVTTVQARFAATVTAAGKVAVYNEAEALYQHLWKKQFNSLRPQEDLLLTVQRMPRKYRTYAPEKAIATTGGLQERLTNWTYKRA